MTESTMSVGHIIKVERIRLEIKQVVLAKGICSPSYLSKIEQNLVTPSEEVLSLLLKKLGKDLNEIVRKQERKDVKHLLQKFAKVYKEVVTERNAHYANEQIQNLTLGSGYYEETSLYYTYNLILIRFKLIANVDLPEIKEDIELLKEQMDEFNERQKILLFTNEGIWYYKSNIIKKSILMLEKTLEMESYLEPWEIAEVHYMIGLSHIADNRVASSIYFIQQALDYFKSKFLMRRVIDCYMLKGIFYKKSNNFNKAKECYLELIKLCNEFNLSNRLGSVYHNLGSLYLAHGNKQQGIFNLHRSLQHKDDMRSKLTTILALISEYFKVNDSTKVLYWCEQGLALCGNPLNDSTKLYFYHFNFYEAIYSENGLTEKIAKKTIEYFATLQDYYYAKKYSIIFANELFGTGQYKLSASFFREAHKYENLNKT